MPVGGAECGLGLYVSLFCGFFPPVYCLRGVFGDSPSLFVGESECELFLWGEGGVFAFALCLRQLPLDSLGGLLACPDHQCDEQEEDGLCLSVHVAGWLEVALFVNSIVSPCPCVGFFVGRLACAGEVGSPICLLD